MSAPTRGERWFFWLAVLMVILGTAWSYLDLPIDRYLGAACLVLGTVLALVVVVVRRRDFERGAAERADRLERELWSSIDGGRRARNHDSDHRLS